MPLQQKRLRTLTAHEPLPLPVLGNDRKPVFAQSGRRFRATVQPMDGSADRQVYGEEVTRLRRLITTEGTFLRMGMGVCVDGLDGNCDFRIREPVQHWLTHTVAVLEAL
ncbi:MAG: hypothetical protein E7319_05335 [Clostridiales bacterium]|nr:hypothetical protein [Clostridiales bacterium]